MAAGPRERSVAGIDTAVLVSADAEWRIVERAYPAADKHDSPYGRWFVADLPVGGGTVPTLHFHGGWGKIAAAASTQYVIDRWAPDLLINVGTCGGFEGRVEDDTVVLADRAVVYDIVERMGDYDEHIAHYATDIDLSWLGDDVPFEALRTVLVSADRDLLPEEIGKLGDEYGAVAGDWESGAIAWVCHRNAKRCLILRGVSDLVGRYGGEAYDGNVDVFLAGTERVMNKLVASLPAWIGLGRRYRPEG